MDPIQTLNGSENQAKEIWSKPQIEKISVSDQTKGAGPGAGDGAFYFFPFGSFYY